ncbi:1-deoxy-D-xylulose-5-phosphate synthase [Candidatus Palibaumannia cicadellinicola]|uniref:1-deoxy-D-xylulose-5-phosphate synthase n=1 Tax=Baumannia cicadellinicola subsp. Homalodisca coagulata TaxID=374463 RepID=DXS_BAUCH|nr:1-deoxy-D-xylulose-5-phosphate synthase [Candidatus Baumannia cicadellinicola]Q1LTI9.1 RecName: Full=1-deoxy-D-xylulose-5-phosphate synthase; AltName: Full=1-deoxyxylulose-5-phosphate synthase; Short=DXP synthase; Short=DXPS [Baumannia cicadellinicola str. Hc (Homalodisca coagulata)]ABF13902.1 1-deoxy-D-xylulose-5-phosphate synthase [Baumannia cicadellinicola str. Hc (Homalodisca coagulata)]MBS0032718.1 1-deoxy-D-xylulose-5-phosphate synthase [Candidatus Baumannia cicadellinicola]MCJ7462291.
MSMQIKRYPTLDLADNPIKLRLLPKESLLTLCDELRQFLLTSVSGSSGHFASGLGTVELTVALHYVYNTPFDNVIWDVGHQAYPHKILTGRRECIATIRQRNGLHPFPWREESEYDILSVGHSSTSISAGLGMAVAATYEGIGRKTVCVIGDGAMTAGMAFEALNHAGDIKSDLLVILNDNKMSISRNVGALNNHLAQILSGKLYLRINESSKKALHGMPYLKELAKRTKEQIKNIIVPNCTLFEELGFNYIGPVDGHDVQGMVHILKNMRCMKGPQLLHIITQKGRGYAPAEKDPTTWHAVPKFDPAIGQLPYQNISNYPTYSDVFGDWLCNAATSNKKLIAITPAMREGSGMAKFANQFPQQYFDVAIAEQHAVTFAAGLAISGYKPVVAIYSTFLQRAYDQVIHDVAIQKLPVLFAIDRGGVVGADGQTHQGAFDLSYLRCVPNMVIMTPSDENECRLMLHTGYHYNNGPSAVRYPRGNGIGVEYSLLRILPLGKAIVCRQGTKIAILNFGTLLTQAKKVAKTFDATLVDMRFVKPLDIELINQLAISHQALVTLEENAVIGGAGSGVNEYLMRQRLLVPVLNIGLPDYFIPQGSQEEIRAELKLDSDGIMEQIKQWLAR